MTDLRVYMLRKGDKQRDLANRLGISQPYLNNIIHGKKLARAIRQRMIDEFGYPEGVVLPKPTRKRRMAA